MLRCEDWDEKAGSKFTFLVIDKHSTEGAQ